MKDLDRRLEKLEQNAPPPPEPPPAGDDTPLSPEEMMRLIIREIRRAGIILDTRERRFRPRWADGPHADYYRAVCDVINTAMKEQPGASFYTLYRGEVDEVLKALAAGKLYVSPRREVTPGGAWYVRHIGPPWGLKLPKDVSHRLQQLSKEVETSARIYEVTTGQEVIFEFEILEAWLEQIRPDTLEEIDNDQD